MPTKRWSDFFLYLGRIFILLFLLAVLLPKLIVVYNVWMSSLLHNEEKPKGNPLRVEIQGWGEFVAFSTGVKAEQGKTAPCVEGIDIVRKEEGLT